MRLAGMALASAFFVIQTKRCLGSSDGIIRANTYRFPCSFCHRSIYLQGKVRQVVKRGAQLDLLVLRLQKVLAEIGHNICEVTHHVEYTSASDSTDC